jgi:hypothetical protein
MLDAIFYESAITESNPLFFWGAKRNGESFVRFERTQKLWQNCSPKVASKLLLLYNPTLRASGDYPMDLV